MHCSIPSLLLEEIRHLCINEEMFLSVTESGVTTEQLVGTVLARCWVQSVQCSEPSKSFLDGNGEG